MTSIDYASRVRPRLAPLFFAFLGGVFACAALTPLEQGTCGNGVIDPVTEDCDGFALNANGFCRPPGVPGACRADCAPSSDGKSVNACPTGWQCGNDRLCRAPTGDFAPSVVVAPSARRLLVADLDGDARDEILAVTDPDAHGFASMRIDFLDNQSSLVKETLLDVPTAAAIASPSDITFIAAGQGIASLRGRQDRTFDLVARSTTADSIGALLHRADTNDVVGMIRSSDTGSFILTPLTGANVGLELFDFNDGQRVPLFGSARLSGDPCETMAYVFASDNALRVRNLCQSDGSWNLGGATVLPFPFGEGLNAEVEGSPIFADINGDKVDDILLTLAGDTYFAVRGIDNGFATAKSRLQVLSLPMHGATKSPATLLAVADINADGLPDYATSLALFVSDTTTANDPQYSEVLNDDSWSEAAFADFNGDARLDVIGASATHAQLTFVQYGTDGFVATPIPTTAIPENLAVLDVDGDLFVDLLFKETRSSQSNLDVLFGRPGLPGPIQTALQGDTTAAIVVERSAAGSTVPPISPSKPARLAIANGVTTADGPATSMSYLQCTSSRQWVSPAFLAHEQSLAIAIASKPGLASSKLALGISSQSKHWHPQLFDLDRPETPLVDIALIRASISERDLLPRAVLVVGDTDGDGLDNAVALYSPRSTDPAFLIVMHDQGDPHTAWSIDSIASTQSYIDDVTQLALEDVDGNSSLDLVALVAGAGFASPQHDIHVLWNDGQGGFDASQLMSRQVATIDIQSFTFVAVSPTGPRRLAYVGNSLSGDSTLAFARFFTQDHYTTSLLPNSSASRPTSITSGDIDGDGLADIVYADAAGIHVARAVPRH